MANDANLPQRRSNGTFLPGHKQLGGGRPKNVVNKLTGDTKNSIKAAAARHGSDGQGTGGEDGFLDHLVTNHPKDFVALYSRLIPPAKTGDGEESNSSGSGAPVFYITPIQSGRFISTDGAELLDEAEARARAGMPLLTDPVTIEGTVEPEVSGDLPEEDGADVIRFSSRTTIDE